MPEAGHSREHFERTGGSSSGSFMVAKDEARINCY